MFPCVFFWGSCCSLYLRPWTYLSSAWFQREQTSALFPVKGVRSGIDSKGPADGGEFVSVFCLFVFLFRFGCCFSAG